MAFRYRQHSHKRYETLKCVNQTLCHAFELKVKKLKSTAKIGIWKGSSSHVCGSQMKNKLLFPLSCSVMIHFLLAVSLSKCSFDCTTHSPDCSTSCGRVSVMVMLSCLKCWQKCQGGYESSMLTSHHLHISCPAFSFEEWHAKLLLLDQSVFLHCLFDLLIVYFHPLFVDFSVNWVDFFLHFWWLSWRVWVGDGALNKWLTTIRARGPKAL